jgi:chemotaxis protein methyltransferase CheR
MTPRELMAYEQIRDWLSARCGIHYPDHKRDLLLQRLNRVQRAFTYGNLDELAHNLVAQKVNEVELAVISAASTNHTYFFRENEILTRFRDEILPNLAARDEIRIWSAACSTGDEVYTIAMMIAESLGEAALKRTTILGTDISAPVIERAEAGVFAERQIAQMPPQIRQKYMTPAGLGQFVVTEKIAACCTFRRMNLKSAPYPFKTPFQIVFCRNVLYYFDQADQIATLSAIHDVTEPGGWLVTSVTESIRDLPSPWQHASNGIYRKRTV